MTNVAPKDMTREMQLEEAIKRLKKIGVLSDVVENLTKGIIMYSERQNKLFNAVLYTVNDGPLLKQIKQFEQENDALVYHVNLLYTVEGEIYSFLYISKHKEEWVNDMDDLDAGHAYAYVINGEIKEIGLIGINPSMGGICRTF